MVQALKPGATALLSGTDERRRERVVLAYQRYGRGKSIAFPVHDSWLWQMHSSIRVEDQTHENFWRQMLRWLVDGVPDAVESRTLTDRVDPGQPVTLTADVVDSRFVELNDARRHGARHLAVGTRGGRSARVDGRAQRPVSRDVRDRSGGTGTKVGRCQSGGKAVGTSVTHVRAAPDDAEYFDAAMHAPLLQRIAQETGGRFYKADAIGRSRRM